MHSKGFTLVELITVITIIAVLSGVGLTSFRGVQSKGRDSTRKQDLRQLSVALELYRQSFGNYYITSSSECSDSNSTTFYSAIGSFMSGGSAPYDPLNKTEKYCYFSENSGRSFRLFAKLENCSDPEVIDPPGCSTSNWNFSVTSADLKIALGPTSGPSPTSGPTSSPTPTIGPTSAPTPTPTPTPTLSPQTITFDDLPVGFLTGQYPTGLIDWTSSIQWVVANPPTNQIHMNDGGIATFSFLQPRRLVSLRIQNTHTSAVALTISCPGQPQIQPGLPATFNSTINTGWTANCSPVSFQNGSGPVLKFDDFLIDYRP